MNKRSSLTQTRLTAVRAMLGGLLSSSLKEDDLRAVAETLNHEMLDELRLLLRQVLTVSLSDDAYRKQVSESFHGSIEEEIYELVRLRKIGRERLRRYMLDANPMVPLGLFETQAPIREIVNEFVSLSDRHATGMLVNRLLGASDEDPYLRGISSRDR